MVTITIWDLWKGVVALWGARMLLRWAVTWATAPVGLDWRVIAWRCQWEFLGFLAVVVVIAASLHLALAPSSEPDRLWPFALALLGFRASLDLLPLLNTCRRQIESGLRWRRFLLRLWCRKVLKYGLRYALVTVPRGIFSRRIGRN